jgi:hypothetical protein
MPATSGKKVDGEATEAAAGGADQSVQLKRAGRSQS